MDNLKLNDMQQHWEHFLSSAISSATSGSYSDCLCIAYISIGYLDYKTD